MASVLTPAAHLRVAYSEFGSRHCFLLPPLSSSLYLEFQVVFGFFHTRKMGSIPEPPKEVDISVALSACDLPSVNQHVKNIAGLTEVVASGNDTARLKMLANARSLVHALETPRETMIKHCWAQVRYNLTSSFF